MPMNAEEYEAFIKISMHSFAEDQVFAGEWQADEADQNMEKLREQILPGGLATPNQTFFALKEADTVVGGLWYTIEEQDGKRQLFVMDIQIYDAYRRHGYGFQAFLAMEEKAREMGLPAIVLHVFMHNHKARAMYQKLGYIGEDTMMWKKINAG